MGCLEKMVRGPSNQRNYQRVFSSSKDTQIEVKVLFDLLSNDISFELNIEWEPLSSKLNLVRYQPNPTPNWGPQARPGKEQKPAGLTKKAKAKQEKRATSPIVADPKKQKI